MNILIIGKPYENIITAIKKSRQTNRLYIAGSFRTENVPNIEFSDINELIEKAKTLEVDLAINLDQELIFQNIDYEFRRNKINIISVNKKWLNLETNVFAMKKLLNHYSINTPQIIKVPLTYPVMLKTEDSEEIAYSMSELTERLEGMRGKSPYMEEFISGEPFDMLSLWDGKNIFYFNQPNPTTEVKNDRLDLLKTKLTFMLSDEDADFSGFFTTHLIWAKNDWYVKSFTMGINEKSVLNEIP